MFASACGSALIQATSFTNSDFNDAGDTQCRSVLTKDTLFSFFSRRQPTYQHCVFFSVFPRSKWLRCSARTLISRASHTLRICIVTDPLLLQPCVTFNELLPICEDYACCPELRKITRATLCVATKLHKWLTGQGSSARYDCSVVNTSKCLNR